MAIIEVPAKEEAVQVAKRFLGVHGDEWDLECEIRALDGPECGEPNGVEASPG